MKLLTERACCEDGVLAVVAQAVKLLADLAEAACRVPPAGVPGAASLLRRGRPGGRSLDREVADRARLGSVPVVAGLLQAFAAQPAEQTE